MWTKPPQRLAPRPAAADSPSASPDPTPDASASPDPFPAAEPVTSPQPKSRSAGPAAGRKTRSNSGGGNAASKRPGGALSSSSSTARGGAPAASSPAANAAAAQAAADALFTDPSPAPLEAPRIGPVRVAALGGGRGRGLITTRTVQPGELLLAVRPLALAWDEQYDEDGDGGDGGGSGPGSDIEPADAKFLELQRQLLGRKYSAREVAWLSGLVGLPGGGAEQGSGQAGEQQQQQQQQEAPPLPELTSGSRPGEREEEEGSRDLPLPARLRDPDTLADVVQANCLEPDGGAEDEHAFWARWAAAAAAAARTAPSADASPANSSATSSPSPSSSVVPVPVPAPARRRRGPMGLWPEASLLNHSCIPNTVAYVVGDTLFVRAARRVGGGAELTVSYLPVGSGYGDVYDDGDVYDSDDGDDGGDGGGTAAATLLSPLADRRGALEELRGFVCSCSRCTAEESLDPKLRALMADISEGVAALRGDLRTALALAELDEEGDEGEGEEEGEGDVEEAVAAAPDAGRARGGSAAATRSGGAQDKQQRQQQQQRREEEEAEEGEEEEEEEGEGGSRWRQMVGSVVDRAGMYLELMDAAMVKLKLTPAQQITAQSAVAPLYTVLWAALGSRGELEPRLAEVMGALVGEVAPGSADHVWWSEVARETAEMIVAEEEAAEEAPVVRRGGGGGGGFSRPQDDRVTIADKACYRAFGVRYGPLSRGVYRQLLAARRRREDEQQQ
ncbi:hypothetical protein PLESTB_001453100 [Pleodorina starrii]|uniref:SET domain-containing protein n=1 Tax=Pleodorina starrii TaxID=330485 RepID=A0A9W6F7G1_9CHLO|nr:hypothetical protein PLESTB_001453100 [Pleodorina starrii]